METETEADAIARKYPWRAAILRALVITPTAFVVWAAIVFVPATVYDYAWGFEHENYMPLRASAGVALALTILWAGAAWTRRLSPLRAGMLVGAAIVLGVFGWAGLTLRMLAWKPCTPANRMVSVHRCAYFHTGSEEHIGFDRAAGPPTGTWCPAFVRDLDTPGDATTSMQPIRLTPVPCAEVGMASMSVCGRSTHLGHVRVVGAEASCARVVIFDGNEAPEPSAWREWDTCRRHRDDACWQRWPQRRYGVARLAAALLRNRDVGAAPAADAGARP